MIYCYMLYSITATLLGCIDYGVKRSIDFLANLCYNERITSTTWGIVLVGMH